MSKKIITFNNRMLPVICSKSNYKIKLIKPYVLIYCILRINIKRNILFTSVNTVQL